MLAMLSLLLLSITSLQSPDLDALHERRATAAELLRVALMKEVQLEPGVARHWLTQAVENAAAQDLGPDATARLRAAASLGRGLADPLSSRDYLRGVCREAMDRLGFTPTLEAPVPDGYPAFTPVGEMMILKYPACRLARTSMQNSKGAFWRLFRHIERSEIAMTAPVQTDYGPPRLDGSSRPASMAFLYDRQDRGPAGEQGAVEVLDQEAVTVLSFGARGYANATSIRAAERQLRARLGAPDSAWRAVGPLRVLEYNSPRYFGMRRYYEVQIPVTPSAVGITE